MSSPRIWGCERMDNDLLTRTPILIGRRDKVPCAYILASKRDGVLYTGVTADLLSRMEDHIAGRYEGFSKKYGVTTLVYYEMHPEMPAAIQREKRTKEWKRAWKVRLNHDFNPEWLDLYDRVNGFVMESPADRARARTS